MIAVAIFANIVKSAVAMIKMMMTTIDASYLNYVIFKSNYLVSILKTTAISKIIDKLDYKNIVVYPIQGIAMRYGFHVGTESKLPDSFQP